MILEYINKLAIIFESNMMVVFDSNLQSILKNIINIHNLLRQRTRKNSSRTKYPEF